MRASKSARSAQESERARARVRKRESNKLESKTIKYLSKYYLQQKYGNRHL